MGFGSGGSASREIERQELERRRAIQSGTRRIDLAFSRFDPAYYEGVRQTTLGSLVPQVERQYQGTAKRLKFALADKGIGSSSAAREAGTELARDKSLADIAVHNQANEAVRSTRRDVETQKQNLTSQLVASQDPNMAAQQAVGAAASISAPSLVAPLGNLFQTFASTYLAREVGRLYNAPAAPPREDRVSTPQAKNYFTN